MFSIIFTNEGLRNLKKLKKLKENKTYKIQFKAAIKAITYLEQNPKHPSLNTHKFQSRQGPSGETIFEAYAQNHTSGAYRIFWYYGESNTIVIISITVHP